MDERAEERLLVHGQRLHPLSPVFEIMRSFFSLVVPGLVVLLLAKGDSYEVWYMLAFGPAAVVSLKRYLTLRYVLTDKHLVVREGVLFKNTRHVPYDRIQNIDTVQNPLHRWLGVAEVRIETASGQEPEAVLRVLSLPRLDEIRAGVFAGRRVEQPAGELHAEADALGAPDPPDGIGLGLDGAPASSEPTPREAFFRMRDLDVAYFGLLSQKGLALLSGLLFLVWEFDLLERLEEKLAVDPADLAAAVPPLALAGAGLGLVLVLQALTVAWAFLTLYDFRIVRNEDDLLTTCGLWTRQSATLPRHRIQFLSVREGWLHRRFGRISLRAVTAGADSTESSQVSRKWLVPLVERGALERILAEVQPETSFDGVEWRPVHPRAWRRIFARGLIVATLITLFATVNAGWWGALVGSVAIVVAYVRARIRGRRLGFAVTPKGVLVRDGVLMHERNAVLYSRVQTVSLSQTPFDRRHGMARLDIDTAGQSEMQLSFSIPYLDLADARRLERHIRRRATENDFRW